MTICFHSNFDVISRDVMSGNGYHTCDYLECADCDSSSPVGCDDETCENY